MASEKNSSALGVEFNGEYRAVITKQELVKLLAGSVKYVDRMLSASRNGDPWLEIVGNKEGKGGGRVLLDYKSVERAIERLKRDERPPLLDCELNPKKPPEKVSTTKAGAPNKQGEALIRAFDHLPKGAESVSFNLALKSFLVTWQNGESQWFQIQRGKGRSTTLSDLTFLPSSKTWNPEPSIDTGYDEPPDPE